MVRIVNQPVTEIIKLQRQRLQLALVFLGNSALLIFGNTDPDSRQVLQCIGRSTNVPNVNSRTLRLGRHIAKISGWYPHQRTPIFENMLFDAAVPVFVVVGPAFFQPE